MFNANTILIYEVSNPKIEQDRHHTNDLLSKYNFGLININCKKTKKYICD